MRSLTTALLLATCLFVTPVARAQATHDPHAPTPTPSDAHAATPGAHAGAPEVAHPVLPRNASWAGVMVIIILLGFFLPAAVIGPIARALVPEEEPEAHAHDEHGRSHDHAHDAHAAHASSAHHH